MASADGLLEGVILTIAFLAVFGIFVGSMNLHFSEDYDTGFNDSSGSRQAFIDFEDSAKDRFDKGDAEYDAEQGITIKESWGIAKDAVNIAWAFFSGGFIENVISSWGLGESGSSLSAMIRILFIIALIFALLYILFKVVL